MRNNAKLFLTLFGIFVFNLAMLAQDNSIGGGEDAAATSSKGGGMPPIPWEFIIPLGILLFYTFSYHFLPARINKDTNEIVNYHQREYESIILSVWKGLTTSE